MNHDETHCIDFTWRCPKECYKARLTDDIRKSGINELDVCWGHYKGTGECPLLGRKEHDDGRTETD